MRRLGIVIGTKCPFSCRHCLLDKRTRNQSLTGKEMRLLTEVVRRYAPADISFTGGETTLYVDDINRIASVHPKPEKLKLGIVTNGWFASSVPKAKRILSTIKGLRHVQMSYDKFHAEFVKKTQVKNLFQACTEMGLGFNAVVTLQSPLDLKTATELRGVGSFGVIVQKISDIGEAKKNGVAFRHFVFDRKVLRQACPNRDQLVYQCGRGFTICCSNLIYNGLGRSCIHQTPEAHYKSNFYKIMRHATFGSLLKKYGSAGMDFQPEHSSPCALCEYLFRNTPILNAIR
ncbi:MAG: radical SAM protein [Victivallaceae bacterium]